MLLFCLPDYAHMLLSVLVNGSPGTHNMHILVHAHLQVQLTCIWVLLFFFFFFLVLDHSESCFAFGPPGCHYQKEPPCPICVISICLQFYHHLAFHLLAILGSVGQLRRLAKFHVAVGTIGLSGEIPTTCASKFGLLLEKGAVGSLGISTRSKVKPEVGKTNHRKILPATW